MVVGGLVAGMVVSYVLYGTLGVENATEWFTVQIIVAHPMVAGTGIALGAALSVASFIAQRQERAARLRYATVAYVVGRVERVDPLACGLEHDVDAVYLSRRAEQASCGVDVQAHEVVRAAAVRALEGAADDGVSGQAGSIGICVFGRPAAGKRRLAWEAVQDELRGWTLLRWPLEPTWPFDFAARVEGKAGGAVCGWTN